jgi:hypothetical protein
LFLLCVPPTGKRKSDLFLDPCRMLADPSKGGELSFLSANGRKMNKPVSSRIGSVQFGSNKSRLTLADVAPKSFSPEQFPALVSRAGLSLKSPGITSDGPFPRLEPVAWPRRKRVHNFLCVLLARFSI